MRKLYQVVFHWCVNVNKNKYPKSIHDQSYSYLGDDFLWFSVESSYFLLFGTKLKQEIQLKVKGALSRVDMRRSVNLRRLKKNSLFEINTFMAFRPRFFVFPSAIIFFFRPELLLFLPCPEHTSRRPIESASVQLENIRLIFSSFGSDARACQPLTVYL